MVEIRRADGPSLAHLSMNLGLDIEPAAAFKREITLADLELVNESPAKPAGQRLRKLRDTHHALARALAAGLKEGEAAAVTGYSIVTVSILKSDPAFQNLIAYYRNKVDETFSDMQARMGSFATDIVEELRDRFESEPEKMSSPFLKDLLTTFTDRTGNGPRTTQVNVNIDLASRLDAARRRAGLLEIDGTVAYAPPGARIDPVLETPTREEVLAPQDLLPISAESCGEPASATLGVTQLRPSLSHEREDVRPQGDIMSGSHPGNAALTELPATPLVDSGRAASQPRWPADFPDEAFMPPAPPVGEPGASAGAATSRGGDSLSESLGDRRAAEEADLRSAAAEYKAEWLSSRGLK